MEGWMDERNRMEQAMGSRGMGGTGQGATGELGHQGIDSEKPRGDEPIKYVCMYVTGATGNRGNREWGMEGLRNWILTSYVGLTTAWPIL